MTSGKIRKRAALAAVGACVALLAFAAVALAVLPAGGTYKGKTSQHRGVTVKANDSGRVKLFKIHWKAPCQKAGKFWGPDGTQDVDGTKDKIKQDGNGGFHDKGKYKSDPDPNGYVGHFTVHIAGQFTSKTKANGTFDIKVRVTRHGNFVDSCHKSVTWNVSG